MSTMQAASLISKLILGENQMSTTKHVHWIGGLLLAATLGAPVAGIARERDNPDARRKAMDEWYNDDYGQFSKAKKKGHKKALWTPAYERFMLEAAKRERKRYRATLPQNNESATVIDPAFTTQAITEASWTNIGPTKANYEQNGGSTLNVSDAGRVNAIVTDPANPDIIYVAFSGGGVWKSTDGGAFWNAMTETLGSLAAGTLEMDPNNASVLYLGLGDAFDGTGIGLVKSTNGADSWSDPIVLGDATEIQDIQVSPANSNIVLVATNKGLYRSSDAGVTYTKVNIATGQAGDPYLWTIAWGGGSNFVISLEAAPGAASTLGQVWRSTDNGATWTQATGLTDAAGVARISVASAPSNRNTMYALAAKTGGGTTDLANIFKSTDNGATWTGVGKSGTSYKSYANTNAESSNLGTLLGGQGWYNHAITVDPSNANIAYFGGQLLLAKTSDGGSTFRQMSNWLAQYSLPYVHADFHAAHIASNGALYMGTDGGIFRSTDSGTTWTAALNEGIASHLIYQVGSSTNNRNAVIAGLQDNGTRVRVSNTGVYNQEIGGDGFGCDVNQGNANLMLGSLYYSRIQKSTDGGLNFTSACSGISECNNSSTAPFRTVLSRWAGDATGNTLYTYSNTKVYKTTNYAGSWAALGASGLPTTSFVIRGVQAAPSNSSVIGIVANSGRVYLTTNGGTSWAAPAGALPNNGSSLSWIAFDPSDRNIVYVASVAPDATKNHLWRSADFGVTWTAIDGSASGFPAGIPVNSVVVDPATRTTLYAATHLGVYRSTDSGSTWARYGTAMPLVNVTDLYAANDGSLIRAATFGRSVWELVPATGGNTAPVANFSATTSGLTATFTDSSSDSDGTIASRSWDFGDGTTSTATNPSKTYAAAGTYSVALTVTDNGGATNTVTKTVTVADTGGTVLDKGVAKTGLSATTGASLNYTMVVPAGATNLTFTMSGGTGDADLYVKFGSAPTDSSYDCRPYKSGNAETCTFTAPSAGTYYVRLKAYSSFSGVSIVGDYTAGCASNCSQTYSNVTDVSIPDNNTTGGTSSIAVSGRSGNAPANASIAVNVVHTYVGDLKLDLIAPDGTVYNLRSNTGGSADNIVETYTKDLSTEALNGTWKLRVIDNASQDTGYINSWSITF